MTRADDTGCMTRISLPVILAFMVTFSGASFAAGNVAKGETKARSCQVCHGIGGNSTNPVYPILAGQHAQYLEKQLRAFKDGTRKDPIMNGMAAPLSNQDIEDVAAFFQSIK